MTFPQNEIGAHVSSSDGCASENSGAPSLVTAAGTGDNTKVTGQTIDRLSGTAICHSCVVATGYLAALQASETLSLAHEYQDSTDNSTWNTAVAIEAATTKATGESGGSNERGVDEHDLALSSLARYFRINVTPNLSASGTDTCLFFTVVTRGGWTQVPQ